MAVNIFRERRLIPRVHLLDAVTKVVTLRTERGKRLSPRFERDAWSREFTFWRRLILRVHLLDAVTKVVVLRTERVKLQSHRFERDAWSLEFTFRMHWRRSLHSVLNGKNGCHHASRETPDPESSPSGCSDEGRCQPDWTGKTAVTTLRERRLIPRVHLLDALTKVVALRTERGKWLSHRFERDAWSLEFTFWMQWRRSLQSGLTGENGNHNASRETPDP